MEMAAASSKGKVAVLLSVVMLAGCGFIRIRDASVYQTELNLISKIIEEQSSTLEHFLANHCECDEGQWATFKCEEAAETLAVVRSRWEWHRQMMLFNANLSESPGPIPEIKEVSCEEGQFRRLNRQSPKNL